MLVFGVLRRAWKVLCVLSVLIFATAEAELRRGFHESRSRHFSESASRDSRHFLSNAQYDDSIPAATVEFESSSRHLRESTSRSSINFLSNAPYDDSIPVASVEDESSSRHFHESTSRVSSHFLSNVQYEDSIPAAPVGDESASRHFYESTSRASSHFLSNVRYDDSIPAAPVEDESRSRHLHQSTSRASRHFLSNAPYDDSISMAPVEDESTSRHFHESSSRSSSHFLSNVRYDDSIPAAPVEGQASSCALDLSNELLGGVKAACMVGTLDRKHCCPVLAAWLMAARARAALHPPLQQEPGMPVLPDDSLVCIASLKAALAARGIFIATPVSPLNASEPCDVVTCFCGIHLSQLTLQSCPLPFSDVVENSSSANLSSSSLSEPALPHLVQHESSLKQPNVELGQQLVSDHYDDENISSEIVEAAAKSLPFQPKQNDTSTGLPTLSSPNASSASPNGGLSNFLQKLADNCINHTYRGCTRCLKSLTKEMNTERAKGIVMASDEVVEDCEMIGLMWLLELNKTLYIPTVSAVVRALLFGDDEHSNNTRCSEDADNMPLALDYSELLASASAGARHLINHGLNPILIILLTNLCTAIITKLLLLL